MSDAPINNLPEIVELGDTDNLVVVDNSDPENPVTSRITKLNFEKEIDEFFGPWTANHNAGDKDLFNLNAINDPTDAVPIVQFIAAGVPNAFLKITASSSNTVDIETSPDTANFRIGTSHTGSISIGDPLTTINLFGTLNFTNNIRQTFNPGTNVAGINVGSKSNADPSTGVEGDVYYNLTNDKFRFFENNAWINVVTGTGEFFGAWTATHDMGEQVLEKFGKIQDTGVNNTDGAINLLNTRSIRWMNQLNTNHHTIAFEGDTFELEINQNTEYRWTSTEFNLLGNTVKNMDKIEFATEFFTIQQSSLQLQYDVVTLGSHVLRVDDQPEYTFDEDESDWKGNDFTNFGTIIDEGTFVSTGGAINLLNDRGIHWDNSTQTNFHSLGFITNTFEIALDNSSAYLFSSSSLDVITKAIVGVTNLTLSGNVNFGSATMSIKRDSDTMEFEVPDSSGEYKLHFGGISQYLFTQGLANWNGNSLSGLLNVTLSGNINFPAGIRQTFNPNATTAGLNVGLVSSEPTGAKGDMYYNSSNDKFRVFEDTAWRDMGDVVGAASSTDNAIVRFDGVTGAIIQNSGVVINDTPDILGAQSLQLESRAGLPAGNTVYMTALGDELRLNAPADNIRLTINNVLKVRFGLTGSDFQENTIIGVSSLTQQVSDGTSMFHDYLRLNATPGNGAIIGTTRFRAEDAGGSSQVWGNFRCFIRDDTVGAFGAEVTIGAAHNSTGNLKEYMSFNDNDRDLIRVGSAFELDEITTIPAPVAGRGSIYAKERPPINTGTGIGVSDLYLLDDSGTEKNFEGKPDTQIDVSRFEDLTNALGPDLILPSTKSVTIKFLKGITMTKGFEMGTGAGTRLRIIAPVSGINLFYSGTGSFISNIVSGEPSQTVIIQGINIISTSTGKFLGDFEYTGIFNIESSAIIGFDNLGILKGVGTPNNSQFTVDIATFANNSTGLVIESMGKVNFNGRFLQTSLPVTIPFTNLTLLEDVISSDIEMVDDGAQSGDSLLFIDPNLPNTHNVIVSKSSSITTGGGSDFFQEGVDIPIATVSNVGGLASFNTDYDHNLSIGDKVTLRDFGAVPEYNGIFIVTAETNNTFQTGVPFNMTDNGFVNNRPVPIDSVVVDGSEVTVTTSVDHELFVGQAVVITGTTNYNGTFIVQSIDVPNKEFNIIHADNGTDTGFASKTSLNQTDIRVDGSNNPGIKDSVAAAEIDSNVDITVDVINSNEFVPIQSTPTIVNTFAIDSAIEGFSIDTFTGIVTYIGLDPLTCVVSFQSRVTRITAGTPIVTVALFQNSIHITKTDVNVAAPSEGGIAIYSGGLVDVNTGDTFQLFLASDDGNDITASDLTLTLRKA